MDMFPEFENTNQTMSLLYREPALAISYSAILGCAAVIGTVGNLLLICTIATGSSQGLIGNEFFVNLAVADLMVTSLINPFAIIGALEGQVYFLDKYWLCKILGSICVISCFSSLANIGLISIGRYVYVCHNARYGGMFTRRNSLLLCTVPWAIGFLMDLPSHVGWSQHLFDEKAHKCLWDRNYNFSYSIFFLVTAIVFNMTILVFLVVFYLQIAYRVGRTKFNVQSATHKKTMAFRKTIKQVQTIVLIFLAYSVCWAPYILILLLDRRDTFPMKAHLLASLLAHIHTSLNFIIYGFANQKFRKGYRRFLQTYCGTCRGRQQSSAWESQEVMVPASASSSRNSNANELKNYGRDTHEEVDL